MSELLGRNFLRAVFHAGQRMETHLDGHRLVHDALVALERAAEVLTSGADAVTLGISGDAFYLDGRMLPHASIEFHGMLRAMEGRGIGSITVHRGAQTQDLADLASLIAGVSSDVPVGGTIVLNDGAPPAPGEVEPLSSLRHSYASSLDALRAFSDDGTIKMGSVSGIVDGFIDGRTGPSLMLATVHSHDEATYYHSVNVCMLAMALGRAIGLERDELSRPGSGALLHDIGRVILDEAALTKPGRLTREEWAQVRLHPQEGATAILAASERGDEIAALIALEHHARVDGTGYPDLDARKLHLYSKIVAIVDAYDAITSRRPHRPARTPYEARNIIVDGAGTAYDSDLVRVFVHMIGDYPPGSLLRLDTGEVVMVMPGDETELQAVLVRDVAGVLIEDPEPFLLEDQRVVGQLLAEEAGVDPATLLEVVEG
jgi:HD-GYP domain-containing protein (c-di-GMP phosphodiesterase class II)